MTESDRFKDLHVKSLGMEPLLTTFNAAELLNVSERQVRNLIKSGKLARVNLGLGQKRKAIRIRPADLEAFVQASIEVKKPDCKTKKRTDRKVNRY